jgi:predicted dehydrogenase
LKVKQLIDKNAIGKVLLADVQILQPQKSNIIADTEESWRLDPDISGGGYFYDIGPHQIDLMRYFFGAFARIEGLSGTAGSEPLVEDIVNGIMDFENGIQFRGVWNFNASPTSQKDECVIYGTEGKLTFSFFGETVHLLDTNGKEVFTFENPKHIQQPMIETVVSYFMGRGDNPCTAEDGLVVMDALERLSGRSPVKR